MADAAACELQVALAADALRRSSSRSTRSACARARQPRAGGERRRRSPRVVQRWIVKRPRSVRPARVARLGVGSGREELRDAPPRRRFGDLRREVAARHRRDDDVVADHSDSIDRLRAHSSSSCGHGQCPIRSGCEQEWLPITWPRARRSRRCLRVTKPARADVIRGDEEVADEPRAARAYPPPSSRSRRRHRR